MAQGYPSLSEWRQLIADVDRSASNGGLHRRGNEEKLPSMSEDKTNTAKAEEIKHLTDNRITRVKNANFNFASDNRRDIQMAALREDVRRVSSQNQDMRQEIDNLEAVIVGLLCDRIEAQDQFDAHLAEVVTEVNDQTVLIQELREEREELHAMIEIYRARLERFAMILEEGPLATRPVYL